MSRCLLSCVALAALLSLPRVVEAGMFLALERDRVDLTQGEQPSVVLSFDEKLHRATVTVRSEDGGFEKTWNFTSVSAGRDYTVTWKQPLGDVDYVVSVEMVRPNGEKDIQEAYVFVAATEPIKASIPAESVDLATRSFDLVTNHPPSHVELEVMADDKRIIGQSTFEVVGAEVGKPVRVTWEEQLKGNVFRIEAKAHDSWGYWAAVDIIPWTLSIPHEDVNFASGKHEILPSETVKVDEAWKLIADAVETYGEWVECALYVSGYTDTVGDGAANQGLSERRALSLSRYFQAKGGTFPIYYAGYGERVLAVKTADSIDMEANRRALYLITAGPPPAGADTPGGAWRRLR